MNDTAKLEVTTLAAAITLGILGDALLRSFPWGVNFALWGIALAATMALLGSSRREAFAQGGYWLLLPLALSPLAFLWHDSLALTALSMLALLTALSLAMLRSHGFHLRVSSLMQYVLGSFLAGGNAMFGMFPLLFGKREWKTALGGGDSRRATAVLCGTAVALPPLLIFSALLMGADAVFSKLIHRIFHIDFTQLVLITFITFWVGGYLRGLLFGRALELTPGRRLVPFSLRSIEVGMMLGSLDLLFLIFVVVQIRYFFGGSALVQATTGLTYADYARRGFFELVTVATLVLPLLLVTHWLLPSEDSRAQRLFRVLAGVQVILLFVIMASAFQRMRLYQAEYGLSTQRLYPTAFMGWLAVVFVWFALTVLRGQRERFAFGAMVAGFLLIAVLHALNPDALIARTNLERARAGRVFDAHYAGNLSADAVPELVAGLAALNPRDRGTLAKALLEHWSSPQNSNWRSWNLARSRALKAMRENAPAIRAAAGYQPKS